MHRELRLVGAIEAGGTKFNCVVATGPEEILDRAVIPTTRPEATLREVSGFFSSAIARHGPIGALGIACFGPLDLDKYSGDFGKILATPKPYWSQTNIVAFFRGALGVPIALETDVNCAAIAEGRAGAAAEVDSFVYVTIGTGIGAGVVTHQSILSGQSHLEVGHMMVPRDAHDDGFPGNCIYHGDCLEGLASASALERRWGMPGEDLASEHVAWDIEAQYLATMCVNLSLCYSPERIILGGGVMSRSELFATVRQKYFELMNGYQSRVSSDDLVHFIVQPHFGGRSGEVGAVLMAQDLLGA